MAGRKFTFLSQNITTDDGVQVQLRKVDPKVIAPRTKYVAKLNDETLNIDRQQSWTETYSLPNGTDVTEKKPEFKWFKEQDGELVEASLAASINIQILKELPLNLLTKNLIPENWYLLHAWKGKKGDPPKFYQHRVLRLREEAERMADEGLAGLASFTWGSAFGKPIEPKYAIIFPIIIDDKRFAWVLQLTLAKIEPGNEDFPYQDAIMSTDFEIAEEERKTPQKELAPETLQVEAFVTT